MGCVSSQQKLDQFQKNANLDYDSGSAATVSNRYAVSSPDDDDVNDANNFYENSGNVNNNNSNINNNADEMSMYTNISDFKVEKNSKNKKKNRNKNSENSSDVDADLDAFKNSMKNKKKSRKQKTNLILNNSSAKFPGTELGVYDQSSNKMKFTGGIQNA